MVTGVWEGAGGGGFVRRQIGPTPNKEAPPPPITKRDFALDQSSLRFEKEKKTDLFRLGKYT